MTTPEKTFYHLSVSEREKILVSALQKIVKWDDFPTAAILEEGVIKEVSYETAHGSNGTRDYMRRVAADALLKAGHDPV